MVSGVDRGTLPRRSSSFASSKHYLRYSTRKESIVSGLMEDIKTETTTAHKRQCPVAKCREELDAEDRKDLDAALADWTMTHVGIARALAKRGLVNVGSTKGIAAHRKGQCGCPR